MTNKSKILWQEYCQKIGVPVALTEKWFQTIQNKYDTEPQRAFHKSNVLELKSDFILSNAKQINTSVHLTFAIFFQYFHFDVKSDCCEKNCDEFKKFFNEAGLNDEKLLIGVQHLLGNRGATIDGIEEDVLYYQDLDLLILGSPPEQYSAYREQLQKEHSNTNDDTYKTMRLRMLETFLQIPQIYSNKVIHDQYEATARTNIKQEIEELKN